MTWNDPDQILVQATEAALRRCEGNFALWVAAAILISIVPLFVLFPSLFAFATWFERKVIARIQNRIGPNRVGPVGLLQPLADGLKMLLKEDLVPATADRFFHRLAPILVVIPAFMVLAVLPFARNMTAAGVDSGVLLFFALGAFSTLGVFLAGWSSRNKYSLLGAMRGIAQMISYEIPLVLSAVPVIMMSGSLGTTRIVELQQVAAWVGDPSPSLQCLSGVLGWYIFTPWGLVGFFIFFIAGLAEVNRSPFDLPEADSEIIAGHLTEYSGFKYALFFMAEYISAFAIAGLAATLFLGGWNGPNIRPPWTADPTALLVPGYVWLLLKMFSLFAVMVWIRATLPRLRSDQLMAFAWKFLLPLGLVNIFVAGFYYYVPVYVGWPVGAVVLFLAYKLLGRIHFDAGRSPRTYRYAA